MGKRRKARATVAITAVQIANSICMESKKKNITSKETEAPNGKHMACKESSVWIPDEDVDSLLEHSFSLSPGKI